MRQNWYYGLLFYDKDLMSPSTLQPYGAPRLESLRKISLNFLFNTVTQIRDLTILKKVSSKNIN